MDAASSVPAAARRRARDSSRLTSSLPSSSAAARMGPRGIADHQDAAGRRVRDRRHRLGLRPAAPRRSVPRSSASPLAASFDQPAVSRMLTKRIGRSAGSARPRSPRRARERGGSPGCRRRADRRRSGGALEGAGLAPAQRASGRCRAPCRESGPSARASARPSSGIVWLQLQIRVVIAGISGVNVGGGRRVDCAIADRATPSGQASRGQRTVGASASPVASSANRPSTSDWFIWRSIDSGIGSALP